MGRKIYELKGQKVSSMHACMQFDVYISDPHYTEKVAIYYAKLVN